MHCSDVSDGHQEQLRRCRGAVTGSGRHGLCFCTAHLHMSCDKPAGRGSLSLAHMTTPHSTSLSDLPAWRHCVARTEGSAGTASWAGRRVLAPFAALTMWPFNRRPSLCHARYLAAPCCSTRYMLAKSRTADSWKYAGGSPQHPHGPSPKGSSSVSSASRSVASPATYTCSTVHVACDLCQLEVCVAP